jgi:hypothetical protein
MAPILTAEAAEVIGAAMPVRPSTVRCLSAYGGRCRCQDYGQAPGASPALLRPA